MSIIQDDLNVIYQKADEIMGAVSWQRGWLKKHGRDVVEERNSAKVIQEHLDNIQKHLKRFVFKVG